jgi:hypothetical protein
MSRRRGLMSEEFKYELAKDLGFYETVVREGWEGIRTKDAGNLVKRAIQIAEEKLAKDHRQNQSIAPTQQAYQSSPGPSSQRLQSGFGAYSSPSPVGSFVGGAGYGQQHSPQTRQSPQQQRSYPQPQQPQAPVYGYARGQGFVPAYPSSMPFAQAAVTETHHTYLS